MRKHGAPDKPSRFLESVALPVRSLGVRDVHTARVCQCDVSSIERDYERELPTTLQATRLLLCQAPGGDIGGAYDARTNAAQVPKQLFYICIDILHSKDCLQHIRWTRRRHDLDQSILILPGYAGYTTFGFEYLGRLKSL